ncbi:MAG: T9SS type A sorting domain-containing protein [Gemmatimonadota bacterium]|nr:MAG: T9SS type A sorting domain-containing protein [Gemmatimonadota bacterium]
MPRVRRIADLLVCICILNLGILSVFSTQADQGRTGLEPARFEAIDVEKKATSDDRTSPQPDTIQYDNGFIGFISTSPNTYIAVRFTPTFDFSLLSIYFAVMNEFNNATNGCNLYVAADDGTGKPVWPATYVGAISPPLPHLTWVQFDVAGPIGFSAGQDFHIVYGFAPGGPYPGSGWWPALDDDGTTTQRTTISLNSGGSWLTVTEGDALVRVGGVYTGGAALTVSEVYAKWVGGELAAGDPVEVNGFLTASGNYAYLCLDENYARQKLIYPYSEILVGDFVTLYGYDYNERWVTLEGILCQYNHRPQFGVETSVCLENPTVVSASPKTKGRSETEGDLYKLIEEGGVLAEEDWCRFAMIICTAANDSDRIRNAVYNDMCLKLIYKLGYGGYEADHLAVFWEGGGVPGAPFTAANGWSQYNTLTNSVWNPGPPKRDIPRPPAPQGASSANIQSQFSAFADSIRDCHNRCLNTELQILISSHGANVSHGDSTTITDDHQAERDAELVFGPLAIPPAGFIRLSRTVEATASGQQVTFEIRRYSDGTYRLFRDGVEVTAPNGFSSLTVDADGNIHIKGIDVDGDNTVGGTLINVPQYLVLWGNQGLRDADFANMIKVCVDAGLDRLNIEIDCCFSGGIASNIKDLLCRQWTSAGDLRAPCEVNIVTAANWNETSRCRNAGPDTAHSYFERIFIQQLIAAAAQGQNDDGVPDGFTWSEAYDEVITDFSRGYYPLPDTFPSHPQLYHCPGEPLAHMSKPRGDRGRVPPPDTTWVPPDTFFTPQETFVDYWYYAPSELYPPQVSILPYYAEYLFGAFTPQVGSLAGDVMTLTGDGARHTFTNASFADFYPLTIGYGMFLLETETMVGWKKWSVVDMYESSDHRTMMPISIGGAEGLGVAYFNIYAYDVTLPEGSTVELLGENLGQLEPDQWSLFVPEGQMGTVELWVSNPLGNVCLEPELVLKIETGVEQLPDGILESEYLTFSFPEWVDRSCVVATEALNVGATVYVNLAGFGDVALDLTGPVVVSRCDWDDANDDGVPEIQTEIVEMSLTGSSSLGPVTVTQRPDVPSTGEIIEIDPTGLMPCESFFDVFLEIEFDDPDIVREKCLNHVPIRMAASLSQCPSADQMFPEDAEWGRASVIPIPLYDAYEEQVGYVNDFLFGREESTIIGDPNGDGSINVLDVLAVVNHILTLVPLEGNALLRADCNGDLEYDVLDALSIVNVILGIGECVPGLPRVTISEDALVFLQSLRSYLTDEDFERLMTLVEKAIGVPTEFHLSQNYPNPFNPSTDIRYQIADNRSAVHTTLKIYNILGQAVRTLVDEVKEPGYYEVTWDGLDEEGHEISSGIYFYRLQSGDFTATRRMVLMK